MDDQQKIYLLQNNDKIRYVVTKIIDFAPHNRLQDVLAMRDSDWLRVHVTERTLTYGSKTYSLVNSQSMEVKVPKTFFGEREISQVTANNHGEDEDKNDNAETCKIYSIQSMS